MDYSCSSIFAIEIEFQHQRKKIQLWVGWNIYDASKEGDWEFLPTFMLHIHFLPNRKRLAEIIVLALNPYLAPSTLSSIERGKNIANIYRPHEHDEGCLLGLSLSPSHSSVKRMLADFGKCRDMEIKNRLENFLKAVFQ